MGKFTLKIYIHLKYGSNSPWYLVDMAQKHVIGRKNNDFTKNEATNIALLRSNIVSRVQFITRLKDISNKRAM